MGAFVHLESHHKCRNVYTAFRISAPIQMSFSRKTLHISARRCQLFHRTRMGQHSPPKTLEPVLSVSGPLQTVVKEEGTLHSRKRGPGTSFLRCVAAINGNLPELPLCWSAVSSGSPTSGLIRLSSGLPSNHDDSDVIQPIS